MKSKILNGSFKYDLSPIKKPFEITFKMHSTTKIKDVKFINKLITYFWKESSSPGYKGQ